MNPFGVVKQFFDSVTEFSVVVDCSAEFGGKNCEGTNRMYRLCNKLVKTSSSVL